jgi:hypothetical protein
MLRKDGKLWEGNETKKPVIQGLSGFLIESKTLKADRTGYEPMSQPINIQYS